MATKTSTTVDLTTNVLAMAVAQLDVTITQARIVDGHAPEARIRRESKRRHTARLAAWRNR